MALFRFEHKGAPMASHAAFIGRLGVNGLAAAVLIGVGLGAGMLGYHVYERMGWLDAFLNASMLLGGMGPVNMPLTADGKLFAGVYALVCGVLLVLASGVILAPVLHRVLHALHAADDGN